MRELAGQLGCVHVLEGRSSADDRIAIGGHPSDGAVVELDLVRRDHSWRHPVVAPQERRHRADRPLVVVVGLALHLVADGKAQRLLPPLEILGRREAFIERPRQRELVEVLSDEDEAALLRRVVPRLVEGERRNRVDTVAHVAPVRVGDREDALHSEDVRARRPQ
eukprot:1665115-Prymnesium_polylepis.1